MELFALALMYLGGVWAAVYLILHDHPWFGLLVLLMTALIRYTKD